jgi:hypothetical protein
MSILSDGVRHPKIYAYTLGQYADRPWEGARSGRGWVKVGYTERDDAAVRIRGQLAQVKMPTATPFTILLTEAAVTDDGRVFKDHEVHDGLVRAGVYRLPDPRGGKDTEWFECTADEVRAAIDAIRVGTSIGSLKAKVSFKMRREQRAAVDRTGAYFEGNDDPDNPPHFLWNAKMRFGKTFTTYQLARRMGWTRVLALTFKPAVETQWRDDLETHTAFEGWRFKGKEDPTPDLSDPAPLVWFASFQDVLGTSEDGNPKAKNLGLYEAIWDAVVIDEYHFGAWREAARSLYVSDREDRESGTAGDSSERAAIESPDLDEDFQKNLEAELKSVLSVRHYLYLSGTPFRALTQGEFLEDQVFNWTYSDEQRSKTDWPGPEANPHRALPRMHLLTYEMPPKLREVAINNQSQFSLTEFFRTERDEAGTPMFVHETAVQKWLDVLRGQDLSGLWADVVNLKRPPLPYEDSNLLRALQHTVWYMPSVDACLAMRDLLEAPHNTFYRDYKVIVAAGNQAGMGPAALPPVERAIGRVPQDTKTITLSCGKLLTGVTVPAWAGILMLRELKSPESYFQAAFRVQSPWTSTEVDTVGGGETEFVHKDHCYVIDFSLNRALTQIVDYATQLRPDLASQQDRVAAIEEFMEFLPVLAYDGSGMKQLRAEDVLDHLTAGISSSMLARRWNSPELIQLDLKAMEDLLANPELLESLEQIEMFRNITNDLTTMITTNKELRPKKVSGEKLTKEENERKKDAASKRENLKKRLQRFITRIPAFMYLTDDRERTVKDIIRQDEPDLFVKVTNLTLNHFEQLVDAGVFNDSKMNDAVWKFRTFEEPSLHYVDGAEALRMLGGWSLRRDERFARLIMDGVLREGDKLIGIEVDGRTVTGEVSEDYGIYIDGIRYESPDEAARVATGGAVTDGWTFWKADTEFGSGTLDELLSLDPIG